MILLDTQAWLWWCSKGNELSVRAREAVDSADKIGISAISCWEVAMLAQKGRIRLQRPIEFWIETALAVPRVSLLAVTPAVAIVAGELEWHNGHPADRIIVATAIVYDAVLVTNDPAMRAFPKVSTIW